MKRLIHALWSRFNVPLALLALAVLAYGIFFRYMGYYWDDYPFIWMSSVYGSSGLERYFSTNRPFWGLIYQFTTPIFGDRPWVWQIFGVFWRWLAALGFWLVIKTVWPQRARLAACAAFCFLLYPGFGQQSIGLMYGHFFIVYAALLFSFYASLAALQSRPRIKLPLTIAGLLLSLINLLCMEYFFPLEALRPLLFWAAEPQKRGWQRIKSALLNWAPYLLLLLGVAIWRAFFFSYQTQNYDLLLVEQLKTSPFSAIWTLLVEILRSLWVTGLLAWLKTLLLDAAALTTRTTTLIYIALTLATYLGLAWFLGGLQRRKAGEQPSHPGTPIFIGLAALLLAGWPFWITSLPVRAGFPNDRFSLPFMLGASLLTAALLDWIPNLRAKKLNLPLATALMAVLLALALGRQVQNATLYRRDWAQQKAFFWQMIWRIPGLQPGTTVFSSDLPLRFYSDNSLTAPLNWIYAGENPTTSIQYAFYYPSVRLGKSLQSLKTGEAIYQNYLVGEFNGSTSQVVMLTYNPPACLRVIDPAIEKDYIGLGGDVREAAALSDVQWIDPAGEAQLPAQFYAPEPSHGWCYYFSQAELARQQADWQQVTALGDTAFALGDTPNEPMERLVFVEGYAHAGNWQRALELSEESYRVTPLMSPPLCALWQRIANETPAGSQRDEALRTAGAAFDCP